MARRYIGIDLGPGTVRLAVAMRREGASVLLAAAERPWAGPEDLHAALNELLSGEPAPADRLEAVLPARSALVRWLRLPFAEPKKLGAVLPYELDARLPVALETFTVDFQQPRAMEEGFEVAAAAVDKEIIRETLAAFDESGIPLHQLGLAPFAYTSGLADHFRKGLLVHLDDRELSVALILEGEMTAYRLLPLREGDDPAGTIRFILLQGRALESAAGQEGLHLFLIGPGATQELRLALEAAGRRVEVPDLAVDGVPLAPGLLPAALVALRGARGERAKVFNLRRDEFALRSQWAGLKGSLIGGGILLLLTLLVACASLYLGYADRARRAEVLRKETVRLFRETFPSTQNIPENAVPLEMNNRLKELQKRAQALGLETQVTPLEILREISARIDPGLKIDLRELVYTPAELRLDGYTDSFDAVNRTARSLEQSPLISRVQIADAKTSLDGSRVDFRLTVSLLEQEEEGR